MKIMLRRLVCLMLALVTVLGCAGFAQAEETAAVNQTTGNSYGDLDAALEEALPGDTVALQSDATASILSVFEGVTLDLNGHQLTADYVNCFGAIVDSGAGLLAVASNRFMVQQDNPQLPIRTEDGYRFCDVTKFNVAYREAEGKYLFQPIISANGHPWLKTGFATSGVQIRVRVSWKQNEGSRSQVFSYNDGMFAQYLDSYKPSSDKFSKMFTLTLLGAESFTDLTFQAVVVSDTGVEFAADAMEITKPQEDPNILIHSEEFIYGSYFDHDRFEGNTGTRLTTGEYIKIRSADALLPAQDITIVVQDENLSDYKVTLGYYTKDGVYTGRTGILPMTDGKLTMTAGEIKGAYFRVNVYIYNGRFTKVPESAQILVYGKDAPLPEPEQPEEPEEPEEPEVITVTRQAAVLPGVKDVLPEGALASAPGVVFNTSPYAYTNKNLFAGKHITKIGIPVKTVQALDGEQTFTLSVVKTTADAYEYVSQNVLKLPVEQLGSFTTVNKWIYVDVDLQLKEDETLAFGMPTDTVSWGYSSSKLNPYLFRSANTNWSTANTASILFDVYATETLEFQETEFGMAAVTEAAVLPNVLNDFPQSAIAGGNPVEFTNPPYCYQDLTRFAGKRITRLGIPVKSVAALDDKQLFTLSVIKAASGNYQYVKEIPIYLPLEQLGSSTTVNQWIYVDLDLQLKEDETLTFGGKNDTVIWAWKSGYADNTYAFRDAKGGTTKGIFFDITAVSVLTYEDYQKQLQEEQERLEAEQAQAKLDAALKEKLAGKGISILGDSISTFQNWSNNTGYNSTIGSNAVYYNGSRDGFAAVNETWWMQTITRAGLELVVNNAWSGDRVVDRGIARSQQLHNNAGKNPDIIAVYLGINDFRTKVTAETFAAKYDEMIAGMMETYSSADVYLFTLLYTTNVNSGVDPAQVTEFNEVIAATAEKYGCTLVDLYNGTGITPENLATYMGDKVLHPNYAGMDRITQCFMDALCGNYLKEVSWEGKKISVVGDSISTGSYPGLLGQMTGANIQNLAKSGARVAGATSGANTLVSHVSGVAEDADLVVVFGGTNDYWHKCIQIGAADSTNANTYVGALRYLLSYLKEHNPNAQLLFVFPPDQTFSGKDCTTDFGYGTLADFRAAFISFCQANDVPYLDLGETEFDSAKHSGDGVHPNAAGHSIIAEAIYEAIT